MHGAADPLAKRAFDYKRNVYEVAALKSAIAVRSRMSDQNMTDDPRIAAVPDIHGHAKGEHKIFIDERPIPYTARMLFLWFYHACRRGAPRFLMVADHVNYLTFEDPAARQSGSARAQTRTSGRPLRRRRDGGRRSSPRGGRR